MIRTTNCRAHEWSRIFEAKITGVKWLQNGESVLHSDHRRPSEQKYFQQILRGKNLVLF